MNNEFSDRHHAIQLRLAGQSVQQICHALHRSPRWFHKWLTRYLEFGPDGLFDPARADRQTRKRRLNVRMTILLGAPSHGSPRSGQTFSPPWGRGRWSITWPSATAVDSSMSRLLGPGCMTMA